MDNVKEEEKEKPESYKTAEVASKAVETNPVEVPDNAVLRKLLVSLSNLCTSIVFEMSDCRL